MRCCKGTVALLSNIVEWPESSSKYLRKGNQLENLAGASSTAKTLNRGKRPRGGSSPPPDAAAPEVVVGRAGELSKRVMLGYRTTGVSKYPFSTTNIGKTGRPA